MPMGEASLMSERISPLLVAAAGSVVDSSFSMCINLPHFPFYCNTGLSEPFPQNDQPVRRSVSGRNLADEKSYRGQEEILLENNMIKFLEIFIKLLNRVWFLVTI